MSDNRGSFKIEYLAGIEIGQVNLEQDKQGILKILTENFDGFPRQRFDWMYLNNPCGKAEGLIARISRTNEIVGCALIFPRQFIINGKQIRVGVPGDFAISKSFRGKGLGLQLLKQLVNNGMGRYDFMLAFPNRNNVSAIVLDKIGFKIIGELQRMTRLLKADSKISEKTIPFISRIISPVANIFIRMIASGKGKSDDSHYSNEIPQSFDKRFDYFWMKLQAIDFPVGISDSSYLNWRFGQSPHHHYEYFIIKKTDREEVEGLIVYYTLGKRCIISLIQSSGSDGDLQILLTRFIKYLQTLKGIELVTVHMLAGQRMIDLLTSLKFHKRDSDDLFMIHLDELSTLDSSWIMPEKWLIFEGDRDN